MHNRFLLGLFSLSLLLSTPSLLRIPRVLPLLQAEVRAAAPEALAQLRAQGLWLVNVDLREITQQGRTICFQWEHHYTSRQSLSRAASRGSHQAALIAIDPREILTTCIHAS